MKQKVKDYLEANVPKNITNKKYEDYIAAKEKEQNELQEMADLMEAPEYKLNAGFPGEDDYFGDESAGTSAGTTVETVLNEIPQKPLKKKFTVAQAEALKQKMAEEAEAIESASDDGWNSGAGIKSYIGGQPLGGELPPSTFKKLVANETWTAPAAGTAPAYQPHRKFRTQPPRRSTAQFMNPSVKVESEFVELFEEVNSDNAKRPADKEMLEKVRDGFKITRTSERTLIYVVVRSKDVTKNVSGQIRCCGGIAFGGYARDQVNDSFLVECIDHVQLGTMPFGLRLSMPNCGSWSVEVPIPEKVLEKNFTPKQRKALLDLRAKYPEEEYELFYLQLLVAN